ncbi:hypothetical protein CC78DRAFT_162215 [Lojkania enalia]|uniref:Myb-like domain-containing protein n=1 Tax=Lojkania enalia TaxID=147567 RepID=A0A9P4JWJ2_9PLEO|nr:hypothetical protein CC78DRAFT_162215 [Didymosphaeria enalia]
MINKVESEIRLPTIESTSCGSSSGSGGDTDDDRNGKHTTLLTRKRKRPPPVRSASHKRQSRGPNTTLKPSTTRTALPTRRQKLSLSQKKAVPGRVSDARLALAAQSSVCDTKRYGKDSSEGSGDQGRHRKGPKSIGSNQSSVWCPQSNAENPSSTTAPHANRGTRFSAKSVSTGQVQWHLSDVVFHSLSADMSFLTALFRTRRGTGILSTSYAVKLLENVVGHPTKLDITLKPLTPDTWFLMSLIDHISDGAGQGIGQLVPALPSLQVNRVDTTFPLDDGRLNDDVDGEILSDDCENGSDESEEYSSDVVDEPLGSRKNSRWSKEDDDQLRNWKKQGKSWDWICGRFPNRSRGALQVRWHTKLRSKS